MVQEKREFKDMLKNTCQRAEHQIQMAEIFRKNVLMQVIELLPDR